MRVKSAAINLLRPLILLALRAFYDKRYLTGRHFESGNSGIGYALRSVDQKHPATGHSISFSRCAGLHDIPAITNCLSSR